MAIRSSLSSISSPTSSSYSATPPSSSNLSARGFPSLFIRQRSRLLVSLKALTLGRNAALLGDARRGSFSARAGSGNDGSLSGSTAPTPSASSSVSNAIDFLTLCHRLKTTKRKGWINHGIKGPESIADHMYLMGLMTLIASDLPGVDRERCIKIAIVHDIAEAIVGDITPSDGVPKAEKSRLEQNALDEMCEILGGGSRAEEIKELWREYENNSSLEANLVKDFDKVEMILQALEYETAHGKILDEFFLSTAGKFQTEVGKSWAAEVVSRRNKRLSKKF